MVGKSPTELEIAKTVFMGIVSTSAGHRRDPGTQSRSSKYSYKFLDFRRC